MVQGARVVNRDAHGDKVLELEGGLMAKRLRRKRKVTSAIIRPYAVRFESGARGLIRRGIATVEVLGVYRVESILCDVVFYRRLEGEPLRDGIKDPGRKKDLLTCFAGFFSRLHEKGIFFRALHFGNVLVLPDRGFGLIDVSEVRLSKPPLPFSKRVRNFKHLFRVPEDREAVLEFGLDPFLGLYLASSGLFDRAARSFLRRIKRMGTAGGESPSLL